MNITIRNIPEEVIDKIRTLSQVERRSLNSELLMVIEHGLNEKLARRFGTKSYMSKELQVNIWKNLSGKWEDERTSEEIIKDIYDQRTMGRNIEL